MPATDSPPIVKNIFDRLSTKQQIEEYQTLFETFVISAIVDNTAMASFFVAANIIVSKIDTATPVNELMISQNAMRAFQNVIKLKYVAEELLRLREALRIALTGLPTATLTLIYAKCVGKDTPDVFSAVEQLKGVSLGYWLNTKHHAAVLSDAADGMHKLSAFIKPLSPMRLDFSTEP